MPHFAKGLRLDVTDREALLTFLKEEDDMRLDAGWQIDSWGSNSVPDAIFIAEYTEEDPGFYDTVDRFVNGETATNYYNHPLLEALIEEGILEKSDEYDVEFVSENT